MCLEIMQGQNYNEKVDVWSFGMVLYELTTNTIPYHSQSDTQILKEVCDNKKTPPLPEDVTCIHPILLNLMKQCWNWDPQQRPPFTQIVQILKNKESTAFQNEKKDLLLYICKANQREDIYEFHFQPSQMTFDALKEACAKELNLNKNDIDKITKVTDSMRFEVTIRNDKDVQNLERKSLLIVYLRK
jgi:serine/threonine protein kinase